MMEFMAMAICAATSLLRILRPSAWAHRSGDGYPAHKYRAQNFALALENFGRVNRTPNLQE
jgi:hypothetical protein